MLRLAPLLLILGACATPVAPTGGPADATPPTLVATLPAEGATNVTERTVALTFSERLASTAGSAITVTPEGDAPPEVRVRGHEVVVTLPALRDSTTYVVTVGTELADQRTVALRAPITFAFSTGDVIDQGQITGTVRQPDAGGGVGGLAVWAYALPDTASAPDPRIVAPDYRTETGADGAFRLAYLRPGPYFVAAVQDRNRNGRADAGEPFAAPPARALIARPDSATAEPATFWTTTRDTIPPVAQRVRPISDRRFAVRFSEPVRLTDAKALAVALAVSDSASGASVAVTWYQPPASAFEVLAEVDGALPPVPAYVSYLPAVPPALADSAGLAPEPFRLSFTPPIRTDTVVARYDGFVPAATDSVLTLGPGQRPGVRFTSPPGPLLDAVQLVADGEARDVPFVTSDGVTFRPDSSVALPARFALRIGTPDSTFVREVAVLGERDVGAIVGRVEAASGAVYVEVRPAAGEPVVVAAEPDGSFVAGGLLPGPYTLRVWADLDGDGRWSGGALAPYRPPEPLRIPDTPVQVRARWETEVDPIAL